MRALVFVLLVAGCDDTVCPDTFTESKPCSSNWRCDNGVSLCQCENGVWTCVDRGFDLNDHLIDLSRPD